MQEKIQRKESSSVSSYVLLVKIIVAMAKWNGRKNIVLYKVDINYSLLRGTMTQYKQRKLRGFLNYISTLKKLIIIV